MATAVRTFPRRRVDAQALTNAGFTCRLTPEHAVTTCARVLWEDDRLGRISEVVELPAQRVCLLVEVPAGRTAAGEVHWAPLDTLAGVQSQAVAALLPLLQAMAADVYARTLPLRDVEPFEVDEDAYQGPM